MYVFYFKKVVCFIHCQLEALLEKDRRQTLEECSQALNVDKSIVGKCLKALGMKQKQRNQLPHELTKTQQ